MAIAIATGTAFSLVLNSKSVDQVSGTYQYNQRGKYTLIARGSATGLNCTCSVGGVPMINDLALPYTGTAGAISASDHVVFSQTMPPGRAELFFRNTTGGTLTVDFTLYFEPM